MGACSSWSLLALLLWPCVFGCKGDGPDPGYDDTPTYGNVLVLADEALRGVVQEQQQVFEHFYTKANLRVRYLSEKELLAAVPNDSVRLVVATCLPGVEQEAYYAGRHITQHIVPVATEGVAVLVHSSRPATVDLATLRQWLSAEAGTNAPRVFFDGPGSGAARAVVEQLFEGRTTPLSAAALANFEAVVRRVAEDPHAVGIVPYAPLADLDDSRAAALRAGLRICAVAKEKTSAPVPLTQGTLADGSYPLRRTVYLWVVEGRSGLGTGFASFVAGHKGQRIILKQGLAPQKVPSRNVMIVNE
jgi:phosphate transport system substrate-binding protein